MKTNQTNFSISLLVKQSPQEVYEAVNDVAAWWTEHLEGASSQLHDEFSVRFEDIHFSKQKLVEMVTNEKVVWLVTDSRLNFLKDKEEWTGTKISFDISVRDNQTEVIFTHHGLTPGIECYADCSNAWAHYIKGSLFKLISEGKGTPG